jgi:hypothetical protein
LIYSFIINSNGVCSYWIEEYEDGWYIMTSESDGDGGYELGLFEELIYFPFKIFNILIFRKHNLFNYEKHYFIITAKCSLFRL